MTPASQAPLEESPPWFSTRMFSPRPGGVVGQPGQAVGRQRRGLLGIFRRPGGGIDPDAVAAEPQRGVHPGLMVRDRAGPGVGVRVAQSPLAVDHDQQAAHAGAGRPSAQLVHVEVIPRPIGEELVHVLDGVEPESFAGEPREVERIERPRADRSMEGPLRERDAEEGIAFGAALRSLARFRQPPEPVWQGEAEGGDGAEAVGQEAASVQGAYVTGLHGDAGSRRTAGGVSWPRGRRRPSSRRPPGPPRPYPSAARRNARRPARGTRCAER